MATKVDTAGRRVAKKGEPALAVYAEKNIPTVISGFAEWLQEQTGYEIDERSVYLASSLRSNFQKSPSNQKRISDRAAEIESERAARAQAKIDRAAAKVERDAAKAARAETKAKEAAAPKKEVAPKTPSTGRSKTDVKPVAAKTGRATAKAAPAKPATTRRRPAKPAASTDF